MRSSWWNRQFFDFFVIFQNLNAFLKYFGNVSKNFFFSNQSITSKMLMLNKKFKEFEGRDFLNRHFTGKIAFIELLTRRMSCDQCVELGLSFIVVFELTKFIACVKSYARLKSILFARNSQEPRKRYWIMPIFESNWDRELRFFANCCFSFQLLITPGGKFGNFWLKIYSRKTVICCCETQLEK